MIVFDCTHRDINLHNDKESWCHEEFVMENSMMTCKKKVLLHRLTCLIGLHRAHFLIGSLVIGLTFCLDSARIIRMLPLFRLRAIFLPNVFFHEQLRLGLLIFTFVPLLLLLLLLPSSYSSSPRRSGGRQERGPGVV